MFDLFGSEDLALRFDARNPTAYSNVVAFVVLQLAPALIHPVIYPAID